MPLSTVSSHFSGLCHPGIIAWDFVVILQHSCELWVLDGGLVFFSISLFVSRPEDQNERWEYLKRRSDL